MLTFTQWAKTESKDISFALPIEEKQIRTVSSFPGPEGYPPQMGSPNGEDSIYPPEYTAAESPTGALSVELAKKKKRSKKK